MKRTSVSIVFFCVILLYSYGIAVGKSIDGRIGTAYATDAEKFGFQMNFALFADLDPYFVIGIDPGIYWIEWDKKIATKRQGEFYVDVMADTNAYVFPILFDAQIRFPNLKEKIYILPYFTIGLGFSSMIYDYSQPEYINSITNLPVSSEDDTKFYFGFTWQFLVGASVKPGSESKVEFLAELGYRGADLKRGNLEVDMSGFIINIGVRYPLGGSNTVSVQQDPNLALFE